MSVDDVEEVKKMVKALVNISAQYNAAIKDVQSKKEYLQKILDDGMAKNSSHYLTHVQQLAYLEGMEMAYKKVVRQLGI